MIKCPTCEERVSYLNLRSDFPKCSKGHELGIWVHCHNHNEPHVYLSPTQGPPCPVCGNKEKEPMRKGMKVVCLHKTDNGKPCLSPRYTWMVDGPPCYMNHLSVVSLDKEHKR